MLQFFLTGFPAIHLLDLGGTKSPTTDDKTKRGLIDCGIIVPVARRPAGRPRSAVGSGPPRGGSGRPAVRPAPAPSADHWPWPGRQYIDQLIITAMAADCWPHDLTWVDHGGVLGSAVQQPPDQLLSYIFVIDQQSAVSCPSNIYLPIIPNTTHTDSNVHWTRRSSVMGLSKLLI